MHKSIRIIPAFCIAAVVACHSVALAATTDDAVITVRQAVDHISFLLNADISREEVFSGMEEVFTHHADVQGIGRRVLARKWLSTTSAQQSEFIKVFRRYLAEKYSKHFPKFIGGTYEVHSSRTTRNEDYFEVITIMDLNHRPPFPVYWHLTAVNDIPKIRNIIVDDVNMAVLERTAIQLMLAKFNGNLDKLIDALPDRFD